MHRKREFQERVFSSSRQNKNSAYRAPLATRSWFPLSLTISHLSWRNFLLSVFCILCQIWSRASLDSLARLAHQTWFRLILLTASCGPILILNTPLCSEVNVVSFYMGIKNTYLRSIFGSVPWMIFLKPESIRHWSLLQWRRGHFSNQFCTINDFWMHDCTRIFV